MTDPMWTIRTYDTDDQLTKVQRLYAASAVDARRQVGPPSDGGYHIVSFKCDCGCGPTLADIRRNEMAR